MAISLNWQPALEIDLDISPEFGHWFAGFVDGEGCFMIRYSTLGRKRIGCRFHIALRDDDSAILYEIKKTLGDIGSISRSNSRTGTRSGGHHDNPQVRFAVSSIADIYHILIPLFEKYPLRSKKRRDFELWREAARLIMSEQHLHREGGQEIKRLKTKQELTRRYNGNQLAK